MLGGCQNSWPKTKRLKGDHTNERLGRFNRNENKCLNGIITGDDMWFHYAVPEKKR